MGKSGVTASGTTTTTASSSLAPSPSTASRVVVDATVVLVDVEVVLVDDEEVVDSSEVFGDVLQFVRESGLYEVQITFMTAFPGTPLYARLKAEGRVLRDRAWELCTLFDINSQRKKLTAAKLRKRFHQLA